MVIVIRPYISPVPSIAFFRFVRKGEAVAASEIYHSMRAICTLYEEWLEVMEDYSTVFSSNENTGEMPAIVPTDGANQLVCYNDYFKLVIC